MSPVHPRAATWRRALATVMPAVMPLAMKAVFAASTRRLGAERGYQAGFAIYWGTCWTLAGVILGPRRVLELWRLPEQMLPTPRPLAAVVLLAPPLGALATEWLPHARAAGPGAVAVATGIGITNALAEETLWRGVPAGTFPDEPLRGWLWPAVGFAAWHHPVATDHFGDSSVTDGSGAAGELAEVPPAAGFGPAAGALSVPPCA